ncbi:MAG: 3,4-dihydroxy-2-butanone-4-phosphate synthase, partial [Candidatus Pelagibacter sp.]
ENILDNKQHLAIVNGDLKKNLIPKVRVLSSNSLDIFTSKNISNEIKNSIKLLSNYKPSVIIIIKESDFSDLPKIINYNKNEIYKNSKLRDYGVGAQILNKLKIKTMILVTKSKKTVIGLEGFGIKIKKQEII